MAHDSSLSDEEIEFLDSLDSFVLSDDYISLDVLDEEEAIVLNVTSDDDHGNVE